MYEFIKVLSESKAFPSKANLKKYTARDLSELAVMYFCALNILYHTKMTHKFAMQYARNTIAHGTSFTEWTSYTNDMSAILFGLMGDAELADGHSGESFKHSLPINHTNLNRYLKEISTGTVQAAHQKAFFTNLDFNFKIRNNSLKAIRRLVMEWEDLSKKERKLAFTRLMQLLRSRAPKSELMLNLSRVGSAHNYEMDNACNIENGEDCGEGNDDTVVRKQLSIGEKPKHGLLTKVAAAAVGFGLGYSGAKFLHNRKVKEDEELTEDDGGGAVADAGATTSASIAAVVKPLSKKIQRRPVTEATQDYQLEQKYDEFNNKYFGGQLPTVKLSFAKLKGKGGVTKGKLIVKPVSAQEKRMYGKNYGKTIRPETLEVVISDLFNRNETTLDKILLHEMVHVYFISRNDLDAGHGPKFVSMIGKISSLSGIEVPLVDDVDNDELSADVKQKAYSVLIRIKKDGTFYFTVVSPKLNNDPSMIEYLKRMTDRFDYIMFGEIETPMWNKIAKTFPVARTVAGLKNIYQFNNQADIMPAFRDFNQNARIFYKKAKGQ